ncbi:hypothetical protein ACFXI3_40085 [Amycolatopsis sp. NPDC059235]|uniref:hypothetical protein n=1 Tax=Amycolatopsis sp. NPDC059235 TaxID=3346782 RepID=UPI00366D6CDB
MNQHMHRYDDSVAELIFDHIRRRLQRDPMALDCPDPGENLTAQLDGLLCATGNDPEHVLKLYDRELSRAVVSADGPRYLSFIPCAPIKAAQLFDMVVSSDSLQGIFWQEAAGGGGPGEKG